MSLVSLVSRLIQSVAEEALDSGRVAGVAIAVRQGGERCTAKGFGYADVTTRVRMKPSTVCAIGSITKQFTAVAVMRLVEEGALGLDDEVHEYLPLSSERFAGIRVRHLLSHTSGLGSAADGLMLLESTGTGSLSPATIVKLTNEETPSCNPGHAWHYSNTGYYLLGLVIERVTGASYHECIREMVLKPCGLEDTTHEPSGRDSAKGYARRADHLVEVEKPHVRQTYASGSLWSTASDLMKWQRVLEGGSLMSQAAYKRMIAPERLAGGQLLNYGYGFFVVEFGGHKEVSHHGSVGGFASQLAYYPDDGLTVVVLANGEGNDAERLEKQIARELLQVPDLGIRSIPLPAGQTSTYAGTYRYGSMRLPVFDREGLLMMHTPGQRVVPLLYQGESAFVLADDVSYRVIFTLEGGIANRLAVMRYGKTLAIGTRLR